MEDIFGQAPTFDEILDGRATWVTIKYYGKLIGDKYGRDWKTQAQYMLNANIGEHNNLEMINNPTIQEKINAAIDVKRVDNISLPALYLRGQYKFNPYPNDHNKFEDIGEIDPTKNVTDIVHDGNLLDSSTIYDVDSKNTAEGGVGSDRLHRADMIFYNNQDTGEVTVYLAKNVNRSLRTDLNSYEEICTLNGPKNYKRISFINGYPQIIEFTDKNAQDDKIIIPKYSINALDYLKVLAKKNSEYVAAHIADKYGIKGQELVNNYNNFYNNATDVFSVVYQVVDKNINNRAMYNLKVIFSDKTGKLSEIVFKNLNKYNIDKIKSF